MNENRKKNKSTENETTKRNLLILIHFMSFIRCSVHAECLHAVFQRNCICADSSGRLALFFFSHLQYSQSTGIGFDCAFRKNWHWVLFDPQKNERRNEPWPKKEKKPKKRKKHERMNEWNRIMIFIWMKDALSIQAPLTPYRWSEWKISAAFCLVNKHKMQTKFVCVFFFAREQWKTNKSINAQLIWEQVMTSFLISNLITWQRMELYAYQKWMENVKLVICRPT